jgi:hypothetical protein
MISVTMWQLALLLELLQTNRAEYHEVKVPNIVILSVLEMFLSVLVKVIVQKYTYFYNVCP